MILLAVVSFCALIVATVVKERAFQATAEHTQAVNRFDTKILGIAQAIGTQQESSGLPQIFEMLKGSRPLNPAAIATGRRKVDELLLAIDTGSSRFEQAKAELIAKYPTDAKSAELAATKLELALAIKRRYLDEVGHLLDFLTEKDGSYTMSESGPRFQTQVDADAFNAFLNRIVTQERDMAARQIPQK
jgi:hypothetical protein